MRATVITHDHGFDVAGVPDPTPAPEELVLAVRACGICGSDLKGHTMMPAGSVLGHEFCGEVVAVGHDARDRWHEGQFAAALPLKSCGRCRWCLTDEPAHCVQVDLFGLGSTPGAFAEYVRVAAAHTVLLGLHVVATGGIGFGDRVLVLGGGSVGAAVTVWARRFGAGDIVVSDPAATRREAAGLFGASGAHDPASEPPLRDFDVVFECAGVPGMVQTAIDAAATRGRVVIAGVCMQPDQVTPVAALLKEIELRFAVYYRGAEFAAAAGLLASGDIDPTAFVTDRVSLADVSDAFARLGSSTDERKILVTPHG